MAATGTLELEFVGNASGLADAVQASQRALAVLERNANTISGSIGRVLRTIVAPIAGIILSAFAAKRALADFANSNLPGVSKYQDTMARMRGSLRTLSEAVGELLAPIAMRTAVLVTNIANRLAPLVRIVTAFVASSGQFLQVLGQNILNGLRPLLPTVFAFFNRILAFWNGLNFGAMMANVQQMWNQAWSAILQFVAPIIAAMASLIETMIRVIGQALSNLSAWFMAFVQRLAAAFGITLPGAAKGMMNIVDAIQKGILIAIAAIEIAVQNMPLLFKVVMAAAGVALDFMQKNWAALAKYILDVFTTLGTNLLRILMNLGSQILANFAAVGQHIGKIFLSVWDYIATNFILKMTRAGLQAAASILLPIVKNPVIGKFLLGRAGFAAAKATFDTVTSSLAQTPSSAAYVAPKFTPPGIDAKGLLSGTQALPGAPGVRGADTQKLDALVDQVKKIFGPGIAQLVKDAMAKGGPLAAAFAKGLPSVTAIPQPAGQAPLSAGGALQFGTAAAFSAENAKVDPTVQQLKQQVALTTQQLVTLKAIERANARKYRLATI